MELHAYILPRRIKDGLHLRAPFHYARRSAFEVLEAKIKSSFAEIAHLVLDTGSSYVMVPWKLALATHLEISQEQTVRLTSASTLETIPKVIIPEMAILGKVVKNVEAIVKDLPPEAPADGLLGLSFSETF